jgi:hypothetical protein
LLPPRVNLESLVKIAALRSAAPTVGNRLNFSLAARPKSRARHRRFAGVIGEPFSSNVMVLPVRIELTTSPFITLMLSHPPRGVCVLDHPFTIGPKDH